MKRHILIAAVFIVLTVVMTYPAAFKGVGHISDLYDGLLNVWILAWDSHKFSTGLSGFFDANALYPHDNTLAYSEHMIGVAAFAWPIIAVTKNPVLAHNILQLLSFVLTGYFTFLLARHLTGDTLASIVAGIIFTFAPYRMTHFSQLQLVTTQWIPLAFLFLHKFFEGLKVRDILLFTLFFLLQFLSCGYYALFLTLFTAVFMAITLFGKRLLLRPDVWARLALFAAISVAVILPVFHPYIELKKTMGFVRSYRDIYTLSADILSYVSPPSTNWIWKPLNPWLDGEQNAFLGYSTIVLMFAGWYSLARKRSSSEGCEEAPDTGKTVFICYAVMFFLAVVFSFGPVIRLVHRELVIGPHLLLYKYIPGFDGLRVPARFGVFAVFFASIFAAFGLSFIAKRLKNPAARTVLAVFLSAFVLMEYAAFPIAMKPVETGDKVPDVYKWLGGKEGYFGVIELPMGEPVIPEDSRYMYFSAFHWKGLVNGYSGFDPPAYYAVKEAVKNFPDRKSKEMLKDLGVRYVIVHGGLLNKARLDAINSGAQRFGDIKLAARFEHDYVYELERSESSSGGEPLKEVPRSEWKARSNASPELAGLAFDGVDAVKSRWTTGHPQKSGDFFELDMGALHNITKIVMATGNFFDYPRGYRVDLSEDGKRWVKAVEETPSRFPIMSYVKMPGNGRFEILLGPAMARFVRLTQTGSDDRYWWSIAEMHVFGTQGRRLSLTHWRGNGLQIVR